MLNTYNTVDLRPRSIWVQLGFSAGLPGKDPCVCEYYKLNNNPNNNDNNMNKYQW